MEESKDYNKVYSERVRAGKRVYFFDIKPTRSGDYYLVVTERKKTGESGESEKHRIFLYKEDINKFTEALNKATNHIKEELMPEYDFTKFDRRPDRDMDYEGYNNPKQTEEDTDDIYSEFKIFPCIESVLKRKQYVMQCILEIENKLKSLFTSQFPKSKESNNHQIDLSKFDINEIIFPHFAMEEGEYKCAFEYSLREIFNTTSHEDLLRHKLMIWAKFLTQYYYDDVEFFIPEAIRKLFEEELDAKIWEQSREMTDPNVVIDMMNKVIRNNQSLFENIEVHHQVVDLCNINEDDILEEKEDEQKERKSKFYIIEDGSGFPHYTLLYKDFKNNIAYYIDSILHKQKFDIAGLQDKHEMERYFLNINKKYFKLDNFKCLYHYGPYYQQVDEENCSIFTVYNILSIAKLIKTNKFNSFLNGEIQKNNIDIHGFYYTDIFPEGLEKCMQSTTLLSRYLNMSKEEIQKKSRSSYNYDIGKSIQTMMYEIRQLWRAHIHSEISHLTTNDKVLFPALLEK